MLQGPVHGKGPGAVVLQTAVLLQAPEAAKARGNPEAANARNRTNLFMSISEKNTGL